MRLHRKTRLKFLKTMTEKAHGIYGKGDGSAWAHMSQQQRQDALVAQAANIVMMQDEDVAEKLTLADAQEIIGLAFDDQESLKSR